MAEKYCSNCCKNINAATFFLHERMCSINVKKCPKCNKPFTIVDLEEHIQEVHSEVECEYCKKKFSKGEIENHKKRCDSKMVPCSYCELNVLLGELKEHQKTCGSITEPCIKCKRYIQRKDMDKHLMDGCPPPKNDRRSVDVIRNDNRTAIGKNINSIYNNINNNFIPININDYVPDEIFFENDNKKLDVKIHENMKKPDLQIRPPSGKKILNAKARKSSSNIGNTNTNNQNNAININNNIINKKETEVKPINKNNNKNTQIKKPIRKEAEKAKANIYHKDKKNDYLNKQNNANKQAILIKPIEKEKEDNKNKININNTNSRYTNRDNKKKLSSKPNFNITKGSMKVSKEKENEEEFRKTRDKLTFKEAKNIANKNMNSNTKINNNIKETKKIIDDEDYVANFNFGDVNEDEQLMQEIIEKSLKDQKNIK